jgi:hypothetical protein
VCDLRPLIGVAPSITIPALVNLLFSTDQHEVDPKLCFVLMPFSSDLSPVYVEIKKAVEEYAGLKCFRVDELAHPTKITDDIWTKIQEARFAIAVLTGSNPNVFYEVGLCHAISKPVILLIEEGDQVPFDLRGIRYLKYSRPDFPEIHTRLASHIRPCLESRPHAGSRPSSSDGPSVAITSVEAPDSTIVGKPTLIEIKAKNFGLDAGEGYFSVSFPAGVAVARAAKSDIQTKTGRKGNEWKSGQVILDYPIVEAYVYGPPGWPTKKSHHLTVEFTPDRTGFLQFYYGASAKANTRSFVNDPVPAHRFIKDQRDEPVYCGVIEVKSQS